MRTQKPHHRHAPHLFLLVGVLCCSGAFLTLVTSTHPRRSLPSNVTALGLISTAGASSPSTSRSPRVGGPMIRTVIDNERGSIYTTPDGDWDRVGAAVNDPKSGAFWQMRPDALKVSQGTFHVFRQSDDTGPSWFPYSKLRAYDRAQMDRGQPSLFISATYAGKKRPVLWNWSLGFPSQGGAPMTSPSEWEYAVNVADDRFVDFWLANYANPILLHRYYDLHGAPASLAGPYPNEWIGVDEAAFNYRIYGVLDDNNHWVGGVSWDAPYPQGSAGMHRMFRVFFAKLKQRRPALHIMANLGTMDDWSQAQSDFANVDGLMLEDLRTGNREDSSGSARDKFYDRYIVFRWLASRRKIALIRSFVDDEHYAADLRSSYVAYLIYRGANFFFDPVHKGTNSEVAPGDYAAMRAALGLPMGEPVDQEAVGTSKRGHRLYTRYTQGGVVYFNYTGAARTIALPPGRAYYDHDGRQVTSLTVPDLAGDYVTYAKGPPNGR